MSPTNIFFEKLVDFHEIQQGGHAIKGDLDTIILIL
jgi:hypothetical protein